jgi:glycosyltransferase involved in cell wall biosynthesis
VLNNELDITVVVSCYNEAKFIADTLDTVSAALSEAGLHYEIIVIDDCSRDNSADIVKRYIDAHPELPLSLVINEKNRGLAVNYVEGAFLGKGKYYRLCCGDNAEPKDALVNIFKHTGMASLILPYQMKVPGKSLFRRTLSSLYTKLINFLSGYDIKYYNGSAIHMRYNVMRWHPHSYGFGFQADIVTMLLDQGFDFMQISTWAIEQKQGGATALKVRNVLSVMHTLIEILIRRVRCLIYGRIAPPPVEKFAK